MGVASPVGEPGMTTSKSASSAPPTGYPGWRAGGVPFGRIELPVVVLVESGEQGGLILLPLREQCPDLLVDLRHQGL